MILGAVKQCMSCLKELHIGWSSLITLNKRAALAIIVVFNLEYPFTDQ